MGMLTRLARNKFKRSDFAIPEKRSYPIPDEDHARMALSRVSKFGSSAEKRMVRAAVKAKFPDMGVE